MSKQCETFRGGIRLYRALLAGLFALVIGLFVPLVHMSAKACSPPPSYPIDLIFTERDTGEGPYELDPDLSSYSVGTQVTLTATGKVYDGLYYEFDYWTGLDPVDYPSGPAGAGTSSLNPITIVVRAGQTVEPRYRRIGKVTLEVQFSGDDPIIDPLGTPVGSNAYAYDEGTLVRITANPPAGYFTQWWGMYEFLPTWGNEYWARMWSDRSVSGWFVPACELDVTTTGNGTVQVYPDRALYGAGQSVMITAIPAENWAFDHWEGDLAGTDNPKIVQFAQSNIAGTAVFVQTHANLTVSATGRGTVAIDPTPSPYTIGTQVTLTANPYLPWGFSHWTGDIPPGDVNNPNPTITMDDDRAIEAVFTETAILTVHILGGGKVHFGDPGDLREGPVAYETALLGQTISVTAVADAGYAFDHWVVPAGGTPSGTQLDVVMNEPKSASAVFIPVDGFPTGKQNLAVAVHGAGTVNVTPPNVDVTRSKTISLPEDEVVTLAAVAETGWEFVEWTGDATGTATTTQITLSDDMAVNAYFVETGQTLVGDYDLHVVVQGGGEVLTDGVLFNDGEYALLIARPAFGWRFDHWEGALSGTDGITGLEMDASKVVTAVFVRGLSIVTDVEIIGGSVYFGPEQDWILTDPELTNMGFASAQNVTITAVPEDGYVFSHWEGDLSGSSANISTSMSSHLFIRPVFLPMMPLNVIVVGGGSVEIGQGGPAVTDSFLQYYNPLEAAELTLTATADEGYEFDRWESTLPPSGDNILTAIMDQPVVCVAYNRKLKYGLTVNRSDPSAASVRIMPQQAEYDAGTWVEVSVYPESGYQFTEWTGDISGTQNPVWVQINDNTEITATIEEDQGPYSVYVSSSDHGYAIVSEPDSPTGTYPLRTPITVTAYPDAGYFVDHWEGDYPDAHGSSFQFEIVKDTAIRAVFEPKAGRPILDVSFLLLAPEGGSIGIATPPDEGAIQIYYLGPPSDRLVYTGRYRSYRPVTATISGTPTTAGCYGGTPYDFWFWAIAGLAERTVTFNPRGPRTTVSAHPTCGMPSNPVGVLHVNIEGEGLIEYGQHVFVFEGEPYFLLSEATSISRIGMNHFKFLARAKPGWHFVQWTWTFNGTPGSSPNNQHGFFSLGDGDLNITAHFEPDALYSLTVTEDGEGTATYSPVKPSGYGLGERVLLEATPDVGWRFVYWRNVDTGEIISCQEEYTYAIRGNTNIEAVFEALNLLEVTVDGMGRVGRSDNRIYYPDDTPLTLTAVPNPGWKFVRWTDDGFGTDAALATTMDTSKSITAEFEPEFNVRTDLNNDGVYTNDDDEYEPGGAQESALGEMVRLSNLRDNGVGHGQARVYNIIDLDGNYIICEGCSSIITGIMRHFSVRCSFPRRRSIGWIWRRCAIGGCIVRLCVSSACRCGIGGL